MQPLYTQEVSVIYCGLASSELSQMTRDLSRRSCSASPLPQRQWMNSVAGTTRYLFVRGRRSGTETSTDML